MDLPKALDGRCDGFQGGGSLRWFGLSCHIMGPGASIAGRFSPLAMLASVCVCVLMAFLRGGKEYFVGPFSGEIRECPKGQFFRKARCKSKRTENR